MSRIRPPRVAAWLLGRRLPNDSRASVLGDFAEEFEEAVRERGRGAAALWYWREALAFAWRMQVSGDDDRGTRAVMQWDDVRHAWRRLAKHPFASSVSVVTMAVAIGAAVATWSIMSTVLLHPIHVDRPDRLLAVGGRNVSTMPLPNDRALSFSFIYPVAGVIAESGAFETVAAGGAFSAAVTVDGDTILRPLYFASSNFFRAFGLAPQLGRGFTAADDRRGAAPVAIVSERVWRQVFGAEASVLTRHVTIGGVRVPIVGVAPAAFGGPDLSAPPDFYLPLQVIDQVTPPAFNWFADARVRGFSPTSWVHVYGRLAPGVSAEAARARLAALPETPVTAHRRFDAVDIETAALPEAVRPDMQRFVRLLVVTVGLLLVIGCLAVGMLLLVRTEARRDELALCLALGASRRRLVAGIAAEGGVLALAGAAAAVPCAWLLLAGLRGFHLPGGVDLGLLDVGVDRSGIVAALLAAIGSAGVMALVAAGIGGSARLTDALRARSGSTSRLSRRRTRAGLVVAQVATALVLLTAAALFTRSLSEALALNPGFDTAHLLDGGVLLGSSPFEDAAAAFDDFAERLRASPAVRALSLTNPYGGMSGGGTLVIDGESRVVPTFTAMTGIDSRYFSTMGLRILGGRDFDPRDRADAPPVAIVNASFGKFIARGASPLGHHVRQSFTTRGQSPRQITIVGVVPDVVTNVLRLEPFALYLPLAQQANGASRDVVFRASADPAVAAREAQRIAKALNPAMPPPVFLTIDERLASQMGPQRLGVAVMSGLGGISLLLTLLGLAVLVQSMSASRRREMGVRAALGATDVQLVGLVLTGAGRLVAVGLAVGLALTWLGAGLIRSFLFRVTPFDPVAHAAVLVAIVTLTTAVSLGPALRARHVDLARLLREE